MCVFSETPGEYLNKKHSSEPEQHPGCEDQ